MLEEAYEAAEAIDENDPAHLKEELGDVLLQVVFHARMAQEAGWFNFDDVVDGVAQQLVFRHPYVFGDGQAADADGALNAWESQKRREKDQRTTADALDAVARSLPALMRAEKIQEKARKAGFDWDCVGPMLDKITEETQELRQAVDEHSNIEEELGLRQIHPPLPHRGAAGGQAPGPAGRPRPGGPLAAGQGQGAPGTGPGLNSRRLEFSLWADDKYITTRAATALSHMHRRKNDYE